MNEIYNNYNNTTSKNNYFNKSEIEQIIINEKTESNYKTQLEDSLCEFAENQNSIKIENISVIVIGKTGVGKSTLINCMLKLEGKDSAKEGTGDVVTTETKTYTSKIFKFLNLTDTRGYELEGIKEKKFNPEQLKDEIINNIQVKKENSFFSKIFDYLFGKNKEQNNKFNDYYHCIWFCVKGNCIDNSEVNALKELKNKSNIPIIVVNTRSINVNEIDMMKKKIKVLFPDLKFIHLAARDIELEIGDKVKIIRKFGLDELLNLTINIVKCHESNDIFDSVKKEFKSIEEIKIQNLIKNIEKNIINEIVEKFIDNYTYVLNETEFEQYIFNLFEQLIMRFSFKKEISKNTKLLLQRNKIKNFIQSYILFYKKLSQDYLNRKIDSKSFEYLDLQVKIEKDKKTSIMPKEIKTNLKN